MVTTEKTLETELEAAKGLEASARLILASYRADLERVRRLIAIQEGRVCAAHAAVVAAEAAVRNER